VREYAQVVDIIRLNQSDNKLNNLKLDGKILFKDRNEYNQNFSIFQGFYENDCIFLKFFLTSEFNNGKLKGFIH
jgi:hypothetical protein